MRTAVCSMLLMCCVLPGNPAGAAAIRYSDVLADTGSAYADSGEASRERIVESIQRRFNARVVRVTEITVGGRRAYEMRLLSDQRVWNVRVDAATGQVLQGSE